MRPAPFGQWTRAITLHIGASWSLLRLNRMLSWTGPVDANIRPAARSLACCLSFLIFHLTRSLALTSASATPFLRSVQEIDSVHSFTLSVSPSHIHFSQKSSWPCPSLNPSPRPRTSITANLDHDTTTREAQFAGQCRASVHSRRGNTLSHRSLLNVSIKMRVSMTLLALAALATNVLGASIHHRHAHAHDKRQQPMNEAIIYTTTTTTVTTTPPASSSPPPPPPSPPPPPPPSPPASSSNSNPPASNNANSWISDVGSVLTGLGFIAQGANPTSNNGGVWIGSDGTYTNNFVNSASEAIILVIWGPQGSWVNANVPLITAAIEPGENLVVSFANGQSGAWSAIYSDTQLVNGQVCNTWGEYTFSGAYSTVDVSREVNMSGHGLEIQTPQCVSNMNTCVFVCDSGNSCETGYSLLNCAVGSQPGANYGTADYGAGPVPSGGCSGIGNSAQLSTTFL